MGCSIIAGMGVQGVACRRAEYRVYDVRICRFTLTVRICGLAFLVLLHDVRSGSIMKGCVLTTTALKTKTV